MTIVHVAGGAALAAVGAAVFASHPKCEDARKYVAEFLARNSAPVPEGEAQNPDLSRLHESAQTGWTSLADVAAFGCAAFAAASYTIGSAVEDLADRVAAQFEPPMEESDGKAVADA